MDKKEALLKRLELMADEWSRKAGLSSDGVEGMRYQSLIDQLADIGVNARIDFVEGSSSQHKVYVD